MDYANIGTKFFRNNDEFIGYLIKIIKEMGYSKKDTEDLVEKLYNYLVYKNHVWRIFDSFTYRLKLSINMSLSELKLLVESLRDENGAFYSGQKHPCLHYFPDENNKCIHYDVKRPKIIKNEEGFLYCSNICHCFCGFGNGICPATEEEKEKGIINCPFNFKWIFHYYKE